MPSLPEGKQFSIGKAEFYFSVATSALQLIKGLSGVSTLEPYAGMLFDFGYEMEVVMTPRGLLFPIEVAFISEDGEIKEIKTLDPNLGFTQGSTGEVRFALEVPVGFFAQHEISVGHKINL